jgi:hypothetical protein
LSKVEGGVMEGKDHFHRSKGGEGLKKVKRGTVVRVLALVASQTERKLAAFSSYLDGPIDNRSIAPTRRVKIGAPSQCQ